MLITYLDIYATLQTFKFSSIQTSDLTYCHALLGSFSVTHKLSDVFFGVQSQEVAQVVVANGAGNITNGSGYGVAFENSTTGTPDGVQYHAVSVLLLATFQHLLTRIEAIEAR